MSLQERLKSSLIGTPLYRPVKRAVSWLRPPRWPAERMMALEEEQVERLLPLVIGPEDNCLDVGGHLGSFLAEFRRLASRGKHFAFEPIPEKAQRLRRKFPDVDVREVALGATSGPTTFAFVPNRSGYSGLLFRGDPATDRMVELHVELARLDDVIPPGLPVRFIKVDVEGAELGVFEGGKRVLRESRPFVLFECIECSYRAYGTTAEQIHKLLHDECGLGVYLLGAWLDGKGPLDLPAFVAATTPEDPGAIAGFNFLAAPGPRPTA
jgi:FkbM family methyltransferase